MEILKILFRACYDLADSRQKEIIYTRVRILGRRRLIGCPMGHPRSGPSGVKHSYDDDITEQEEKFHTVAMQSEISTGFCRRGELPMIQQIQPNMEWSEVFGERLCM